MNNKNTPLNRAVLSNNIRKYRLAAGYNNMKEVAGLLHVPYTTYTNYEGKKATSPGLGTLINMANLFNVTVSQLLGEDLPVSAITLEDIMKYLTAEEQDIYITLSKKISEGRNRDGKEAVPRITFP